MNDTDEAMDNTLNLLMDMKLRGPLRVCIDTTSIPKDRLTLNLIIKNLV